MSENYTWRAARPAPNLRLDRAAAAGGGGGRADCSYVACDARSHALS